jgi:hypothetical protein
VNLIRSFCEDFEVIVPFRCQSAATLMALGSDRIIMTKQATLGPIDPSTNGLMNPQVNIDGKNIRVPVSVEHVNAYIDMARKDLSIKKAADLKDIYLKLTDKIFPLTLGEVYKSRSQIQMLAEKLLKYHNIKKENISKVISFLCSGSGSHDYTIYRKEAKEDLGLNIEKPNDELYKVIKEIYDDIEKELELRNPFTPKTLLAVSNPAPYKMRRALIESVKGGCEVFKSEGSLSTQTLTNGQVILNDNKTIEGWYHENLS